MRLHPTPCAGADRSRRGAAVAGDRRGRQPRVGVPPAGARRARAGGAARAGGRVVGPPTPAPLPPLPPLPSLTTLPTRPESVTPRVYEPIRPAAAVTTVDLASRVVARPGGAVRSRCAAADPAGAGGAAAGDRGPRHVPQRHRRWRARWERPRGRRRPRHRVGRRRVPDAHRLRGRRSAGDRARIPSANPLPEGQTSNSVLPRVARASMAAWAAATSSSGHVWPIVGRSRPAAPSVSASSVRP